MVGDLTLEFREQFKNHFPAKIVNTSYVISLEGSGNPIFTNQVGQVFICYNDMGEIELLADSFEEMIVENFFEW
ncbi:hypothetical protein [Lysinibacillus xylanilyticus]|uniref:hypothetical protein n=1 Tax=Lysinibacillus xylanilyticus TaxID=582475 RepID=UPI0020C74CFC|nr:hypothetical protein [Lysinibacillus xylanilyticus]